MKKYVSLLMIASLAFTACSKDWTTPESKADEFEEVALNDLKEKRDNFKWIAEADRIKENEEARLAYFADLRDYKEKAWLNSGASGGQTPFFYFWYSGDTWKSEKGIAKSWLQSLPDSLTAISLWGGLGGMRPSEITNNMKKDLEIFHEKGSIVLMCWQTSGPGLGMPGNVDGSTDGWNYFREKYPFTETYHQWAAIYARELARYIIALGIDGYDVDWETCGDHGSVSADGHSFMISDNGYKNIGDFVREIAKYFGPKYSGEERKAFLEALFNPETEGFHENEKIFIDEFKPYVPENYATKKYYLAADVPCGVAPIFSDDFRAYFDKHFLQDYTVSGVGTHITHLGGPFYNSTSANYQAGGYSVVIPKAIAISQRSIWGFGAYHGQTDFDNTSDNNPTFNTYLKNNNITRKYNNYAWTREAIRIADPRPSYANYKELDPVIITP